MTGRIRFVTLNVDHRTRVKDVPFELIDALIDLGPDILVLTEFVEPTPRKFLRSALANAGLSFVSASDPINYARGHWSNQVLIASRWPLERLELPLHTLDSSGRSNILCARTSGLVITGVRAPYYEQARDWYDYWAWLEATVHGDVIIGDLNTDLPRDRPRDRVLKSLIEAGGWRQAKIDGDWSYKGQNGNTSKVDHFLCRGAFHVAAARYVAEPFVPNFTDHAALVVDCCSGLATQAGG